MVSINLIMCCTGDNFWDMEISQKIGFHIYLFVKQLQIDADIFIDKNCSVSEA